MESNKQPTNKWSRLAKWSGLLWLLGVIVFIVVSVIAGQRSGATDTPSPAESYTMTGLFVINGTLMMVFLFSRLTLFIAKRRAPKEHSEHIIRSEKAQPVGWRAHKKLLFVAVIILIPFLLVLFSFGPENCKDAECFISAVHNGKDATLQSTDSAGTEWRYQIRGNLENGQMFTKTLLRLDDKEPRFMKNFLQGKSLTCTFQDNFDMRLITSLFYGVDSNCSGELKENIGKLLFLLK